MDARNIEDIYPLSPMQQGMLFHSLYAPESGVYFEQSSWTLHGELDVAAFERAWRRVIERHSALRTAFVWEGLDEPLQVVQQQVELPLEQYDWRGQSKAEQKERLAAFLQAERERGFDLAHAPLMRLALIRTAEQVHQFVWSRHHLLSDGWSQPILFREVVTIHEALRRDQDLSLPPAYPYRNYIAWLQEQDMAEAERFWRQTLKGFTAPTPLLVDGVQEHEIEQDYVVQRALLPAQTMTALQSLARQHQLTLNTLVQGAWALLLSRYSGEDDVVFGATVSGRPAELPAAQSAVGLFINTLPVRVQVSPQATVLSWLQELQVQQAELRQYEYSPLVEIRRWSDVPPDQPLFESILVFENYPMDAVMQDATRGGSLKVEVGHSFTRANYPLTLAVSPGRELGLEVGYDCHRFSAGAITRMLGHLQTLLEGVLEDPERPVATLPLLTRAERQQLLVEWNNTRAEYPSDQCAHEWFEAQAERTPDAVAVAFPAAGLGHNEDQNLKYRELNQRANQLAHYLRELGVGPETMVGICAERSLEMIVGLLGVLKAGGAYVPLDPDYPPERLAFMLQDTQVPVLLTQEHLLDQLPQSPISNIQIIKLDTDWPQIVQERDTNPTSGATPESLAYVIYTSGSTGQPKGTLLQHRGLCNFIYAFIQALDVGTGRRLLQFASFSFDASISEIFTALLSGATLYLAQRETLLSVPDLTQLLREQEITSAILPPAVLKILPTEELPDLRAIASVGEACTPEIVTRWAPGRRFLNGYGPTEITIGATWGLVTGLADGQTNVPIGRPIANTLVYLLDAHLQPVPIGVPGELHIGGVGVARGYLNRPELTREKFISNPFSDDYDARLYKTGDLACYLPDGNIEFLGRIDHQVKLRGFRIELGEIEALLGQHPDIQSAAVLAREDERGERMLVAYVVAEGESALDSGELRDFVKDRLPPYMVPAAFVALETMPLTSSGKVDRRALPAPDWTQVADEYVAPRTPVEEMLVGVWAQVLGIERVGVHDNFFELGGHSLLATQLVSRLREAFQIELPLRSLFEAPTVAGLVEVVQSAGEAPGRSLPPIEPVSRPASGDLPLSFAQQRLWFLDQLEPGNLFYNIPTAMRLTGKLDVEAMERALNEVVRRHEALRTTFKKEGGKPVQVIAPELALHLPVSDLRHLPQAEREAEALLRATAEARKPFDLAEGPLVRASLLRLDDQEHIALFTVHHVVADGWSMNVLVREVATLYRFFFSPAPGEDLPLPELPVQYADFAHWQREWLQGEALEAQVDYWKGQLAGSPPMLELPTDRPRPAVQSSRGTEYAFTLPGELAQALKALSQGQGSTLFMTLLAAFQALLYRYTGQDDISVGTPIANRTRGEIEDLIGFFVNTLVMRTDLSGDPSFEDLLARVRKVALEAYAHQDLPFEMLVEELRPQRDMSHTPLFQVMFVLNNAPTETLELPDLTIRSVNVDKGTATFDLTLQIAQGPDMLGGYVEYNTDLFDRETIARMVAHFQTLLEGIVADPEQPLSRLPLLAEAERQQLLVEWNQMAMDFPRDTCIHHLFEAQAEARPNALAAIYASADFAEHPGPSGRPKGAPAPAERTARGQEERLTYAELNQRANQLAYYLHKLGVGVGTLVGISTERSLEMVVGILGTLKAGGAYLPLDPAYPQERLAFMIEDSQIPVLLTQAHLVERLPISGTQSPVPNIQIVKLDQDWEKIAQELAENPESAATAESLAYVIYTSGSTGLPKGTMLRHRGLCNLTGAQQRAFGIREGSRVLQFSPFSFDASVWETFMALRNGATLVLAPQETLASGQGLVKLLGEQGVTNVTLPPSVLAVLPEAELPALETVIAAGEACTADLVARWAPGRDFFNAYGPTETTVCASMYRCDEGEPGNPPIGRPIDNTRLYVVDGKLQPVPVGVPGELLVGGVSLARGYLNRPELTAEKFVRDPYSDEPGARLYRTGDLVRYRRDGNLEFLGRLDQQVKVRGFRIELGEIEAVLGGHAGLQDSAVIVREDVPGDPSSGLRPGKRLVAYVVPGDESEPNVGELRSFLRQTLPEYMVPTAFVTLEALPLSPSGKVDRNALPAPDKSRPDLEREYVAPRNEIEEKLTAICAELLDIERVGVYDSFFDLGGHSLLATQFISRVRETFDVELPLRTLFEHPTVAELTEEVIKAEEQSAVPQAPAIAPLSRESRRVRRSAVVRDGD